MPLRRAGRLPAFVLLVLASGCALALDNPDAPDRVAAFEAREAPYREAIHVEADTTAAYRAAYDRYERFLDGELNRAYQALRRELDDGARQQLRAAQRAWIDYRDAAFAFIEGNWRREDFGSSAVISRGGYRTRIIRDRVLTLLHYLQNYP